MVLYTKKGNKVELHKFWNIFHLTALNDNLQGWFQCLQAKTHEKNIDKTFLYVFYH